MDPTQLGELADTDFGSLEYVALLVEELDEALKHYREAFLAKVTPRQEYTRYGFSCAFVDLGYARLKLMQPYGSSEQVTGLTREQSQFGIHHVSYRVEYIEERREQLLDRGYRPFGTNAVVGDPGGGRATFLRPPNTRLPLVRLFEPA